MISEPSRHCTVELQALPSRIGQVRRIISAQLRHWQLDALIDQTALGVTELLTNVHRHAQPDKSCTVEIEWLLERLMVSVHDTDPRLPTVREADDSSTSGRGLALIAAVSESWGVRPRGGAGKVVWFTLPAPAALGRPPGEVYGATTDGPFGAPEPPVGAPPATARSAVVG
ncbi:ATP-binding protein [Streptomyces sp. OfavH-34-F]|uniref:ATP-binding protein n=1 Tax=Streptomyces sp. OfavH-34-F TaxID=2917760 RepID=UPI001EF2A639|nr:ATP-binding protein [Streptomyces sp. OfavH-34-F]MCG7526176.1 ATP-binding protein [Streptomyces sp. OfavH-34-F]